MTNGKYFWESLSRGISGIVYSKYGGVAVDVYDHKDSKEVQIIIYDVRSATLKGMSTEEEENHKIIDEKYSIKGIDYSNKQTVFQHLEKIISGVELKVHGL